jgi:phosphoheptose isomerase
METEALINYEIIKCGEAKSFCDVADHLQQKLVGHFQEIHYGRKI